jgi:hypothetical protein
MKTRTVTFSFGTIKNADLHIPAEDFSLFAAAQLIRQSFLEYMFRPGCGLMSDEVLVSSIGRCNFFDGALGGYETRLSPADFKVLSDEAKNDIALACDGIRFRAEKQGRELSRAEVFAEASRNESLGEDSRKMLSQMSKVNFAA